MIQNRHEAATVVVGTRAYVDTAFVYLSKELFPRDRRLLDELCGEKPVLLDPMPYHHMTWQRGFHLRRPSDQALEVLAKHVNLVSRLDVALDLTTGPTSAAGWLHHYLNTRLVLPYRARAGVRMNGGTTYFAREAARNNLVIYSDAHSARKTEDGHTCCHLEWRVRTARALAPIGIRTVQDVLNLDYRKFWRKRLRLREADDQDLRRLGRTLRVAARRPKRANTVMRDISIDWDLRAGSMFVRRHCSEYFDGDWSIQEILREEGQRWSDYFPLRDVDWMLPDPPSINDK